MAGLGGRGLGWESGYLGVRGRMEASSPSQSPCLGSGNDRVTLHEMHKLHEPNYKGSKKKNLRQNTM